MKSTSINPLVPNFSRHSVRWQAALLAAALPCLTLGLHAQTLQGQNKGNTSDWFTLNLQGWAELDYIPMRVAFDAGSAGTHTVTLNFPHYSGKTFGFEDLSSFSPSANAAFTAAPKLTMSATGNWTYTFTVNLADNNPAEVRFLARLASGAHLYGGSSLQLKGSAGNLQIHKPLPSPGAPDLALSLSGPASVVEGQTLTYSLTYTNQANLQTATGAQLNQFLPAEISVDPATLPANARLVGNTLFWDLGNLAPHTGGSFSFTATVNPGTVAGVNLVNLSQIVSAENDLNPADNETTLTTAVVCGSTTPVIVSEPSSVSVCPGDPVVLSVSAVGPAGMTYQWLKDGVAIPGATDSTYVIPAAGSTQAGVYTALVSSPCGSATSQAAALSFNAEPATQILTSGFQPDGTFALTFSTGCGGTYIVEYSADLAAWSQSPVTFTGNGAPARWVDAGPPATDSLPSTQKARFYRIVRVY